eukprot:CAMPEP_0185724836 /NCGR_PEP_ID=MMETSP1171-20130828/1210_1 /TAXON_ID=374046 /ORGANISM="Helicotheca tamensis, Strain CCMP826" /LENGTH=534 /DNA_ID=CAMNT_0028392783 /DNA_START=45 /DNA_END=1649 /DNA_ORIENTATION=-
MKLSSLSFALAAVTSAPLTSAFTFSSPRSNSVAGSTSRKVTFGNTRPLFGILDEVNSDAFDLLGGGSDDDDKISPELDAAYETFLAELVFSANDPRVDIVNNIDRCGDEEWLGWLENKVKTSIDAEEKTALRDLYEMILDIKKQLEVSRMAEERAEKEAQEAEEARVAELDSQAEAGRAMSDTDVLRKATEINTAGVAGAQAAADSAKKEKKSFLETDLTPEIRLSYEDMVKKVLPPYKAGDSPASIVFNNYEQFDAQFVKVLTERANNGDSDSQSVLDALAVEQQKRIAAATETLKEVLSLGDPMRMEGAIVRLARDGKIDEPFLLLLEANANQAEAAGAKGPAQLMRKLRDRAADEKDKQSSSKEIKLLRQLLRTDESSERESILEEAFTPKEALLVPGTAANAAKAADGEQPEEEKPMPEVPPPDFINACKAVLLNFGNLSTDDDRGDLTTRIKQIASEAEVVATRIYGKGMSAKEQQDRAWKEATTSIFDLETLEIEAERMGQTAPWTNPDSDDILPGFDAGGRMKIGGQ